jgi:hypothetical protein
MLPQLKATDAERAQNEERQLEKRKEKQEKRRRSSG